MSEIPLDLQRAVEQITTTDTLLTCWDFDGTLAPIVANPADAKPLPGTVELLSELAALPETHVALLSGRARADLARLSGVQEPIELVGCHGAEFPPRLTTEDLTQQAELLRNLIDEATEITSGVEGVLLETKPVSVAVHVRNVPDRDLAAELTERVLAGPGNRNGVQVTTGKEVVELSVAKGDKGQAIQVLRREVAATAVSFAGDDVTDEHGFDVLQPDDLGVKVGSGPTSAGYRVSEPEDVQRLLRLLVSLRESSLR